MAESSNRFCHKCGSQIEIDFVYCTQCGTKVEIELPCHQILLNRPSLSEREVIETYFNSGFEFGAICEFLAKYYNIEMSLSTLKRRLRDFGLKNESGSA